MCLKMEFLWRERMWNVIETLQSYHPSFFNGKQRDDKDRHTPAWFFKLAKPQGPINRTGGPGNQQRTRFFCRQYWQKKQCARPVRHKRGEKKLEDKRGTGAAASLIALYAVQSVPLLLVTVNLNLTVVCTYMCLSRYGCVNGVSGVD
jgi:hypothetical protein